MKLKSYFLLTLGLFAGIVANAQINEFTQKSYSTPNQDYQKKQNTQIRSAARSVDTVWSNNFSDTTLWNYQSGMNQWNIVTSLSQSLVSQGFDAALMSASGGNFAFIDSDGAGSGQTQDATIDYIGPAIDCGSYPNVQLVFETYFRTFQDQREIIISGDGGATWDTIQVLTQFGSGITSPNPYLEVVDISAYAGAQTNVLLKFRYMGSYDWFWTVDDVAIVTVPDNELELVQEFYNTTADDSYETFYSMLPLKQADSMLIHFGAEVANNGVTADSLAKIAVNVKFNDSNLVHSDTVMVDTLWSGMNQMVDFVNPFAVDSGLGSYNIRMEVFSDSADALPRNNVMEHLFEVSSYQYRRDNDTVNSDNWFNVNNTFEMLVRYEIFKTDTVVAVSTYFPFNYITGRGVNVGDSISYYVYKSNDLENPVSETQNYIVKDNDVNTWVTLPLLNEELEPGLYYVGFKTHGDNSSVGTNSNLNGETAPLTVLVRTDALSSSAPWNFTTVFTPFIRMFTKVDSSCTDVNIGIDFIVTDSLEEGEIMANVTGSGAAPFNYLWSGPNGFSSMAQNIAGLTEKGMYTLEVTDVFGCTEIDSVQVSGSVFINELNPEMDLTLYPNPVENILYITGNAEGAEIYNVQFISSTGNVVTQDLKTGNGNFHWGFSTETLASGLYLVVITKNGQRVGSTTFVKKN